MPVPKLSVDARITSLSTESMFTDIVSTPLRARWLSCQRTTSPLARHSGCDRRLFISALISANCTPSRAANVLLHSSISGPRSGKGS